MKHLQLLTLVSATLPCCINALVLGTGTTSSTQSLNQSSSSSSSSTSSTSSSSIISSSSSSTAIAWNSSSSIISSTSSSIISPFDSTSLLLSSSFTATYGAPTAPSTSPAFPGASITSTVSSSSVSSQWTKSGVNSSTALSQGNSAGSSTANSDGASGTTPSSSASSFPVSSGNGTYYQGAFSTSASGGARFPTRPNYRPSSIGSVSSGLYKGTNGQQNTGFPKATHTAGTGLGGGITNGTRSSGTGFTKGIFPSGTGRAGASGGFASGIFPPTGTNPRLTASGGGNATVPTRAASCGLCDVIIPQVQVQYFPVNNKNASCTQSAGAGPSITPPPAPALVKRRLARRNGTFAEEIAVSGDYTFTAPSMYVVMSEGIHVTDRCGTIGSSLASAVVPVSAGALQSVSYNIPVGQTLTTAVLSATSYTKPLLPEDLACPTWGISGNWNPRPDADPLDLPGGIDLNIPAAATPGATSVAVIGVVQVDTVVGPPWYPILVLPHEVLGLDPLWESCVGRLLNPSFPIFDPPHALQGQTELVSSSAPAYAQAEVTTGGNKNVGGGGDEVLNAGSPPNTGGSAIVKIPESQLVQPSPLALAPAPTLNTAAAVQVSDTANNDPGLAPNPPAAPPTAENTGFMQSLSAALAVGPPVSTVNVVPVPANKPIAANVVNPPPPTTPSPLSVGGQQVQQQGSTLIVGDQSIAPGSTASVAGHQVVNNGDNVVVDGSSQVIQPNPTPAPVALPSVAGQQIQQSGSNLIVAGQTITPGSTGSVGGHAVVNNGDAVVVDSSTQPIQPIQPSPAPVLVAANTGNDETKGVAPEFQSGGGNPAAVPLPSVGGQQIQQQGSSLVVAGQTIGPGATASVGGHQVVNNGDAVVVDGSSQALPPAGITAAPASSPVITIGGTPYTAGSSSNFVINGQTLNPSNPITLSGTPISILPGGTAVAIGSSTQAITTPTPNFEANAPAQGQPPLTIDGSTYLPTGPSSAYILPGGQTLTPGAQVTVGGVPVSLAPDGSAAVVGGSTENLAPTITPPPGQPAITFAGSTFRPLGASSAYIIDGQTLTPGAAPITVSGTPISLYTNGATAVVGSSTENLQPPITSAPGLTFDGTTYQPTSVPGASSAYVIDGQTITPGASPVTISGTPISIASNGHSAVIGGSTQDLEPSATPEPAITFDGSTIHPVTGAPSDYIINGQTLTPGGKITVSGTPISLATNAASAIIGTSTENLQMTEPPLTFGGSTYYPTGPSSAYVIDGQTITPGASITISGTPISLASDGASAIVGTSTEDLLPSLTSGAVLTVGGQTFTPNPSSFILDGKTMTVGGTAIISGTPVVLEPSGTLMVGTSEIPLATSSGSLFRPSGRPPKASAAAGQRQVPWTSLAMGFIIGTGILYII